MSTIINADTSDGLKLTSDTSGEIKLQSAGTDTVTVNTSGNVGIGTSSPLGKLQVVVGDNAPAASGNMNTGVVIESASASRALNIGVNNTAGYSWINSAFANNSGVPDNLVLMTGATERMRIDSSGNVGIGTSSPAGAGCFLNIQGSASSSLVAGSTSNANFVSLYSGQTVDANPSVLFNNSLRFGTATSPDTTGYTERMRIDSSGNVLVNTTTTGGGKLVVEATSANQMVLSNKDTGASSQYACYFLRNNSVVGSIQTTNIATSYITSSDYRLKDNVLPMSGSIDRLKQLKPSTWSWKLDGSHGEGFIAHEAQAVVPEAISGTKDAMRTEEYEVTPAVLDDDGNVVTEAVMGTREVPDYQGIDQAKLVPLLTAALQEAITKIEDLETRIQALENA